MALLHLLFTNSSGIQGDSSMAFVVSPSFLKLIRVSSCLFNTWPFIRLRPRVVIINRWGERLSVLPLRWWW